MRDSERETERGEPDERSRQTERGRERETERERERRRERETDRRSGHTLQSERRMGIERQTRHVVGVVVER